MVTLHQKRQIDSTFVRFSVKSFYFAAWDSRIIAACSKEATVEISSFLRVRIYEVGRNEYLTAATSVAPANTANYRISRHQSPQSPREVCTPKS